MPEPMLDQWASWILHRRHGDDAAEYARTLERLAAVRDRVLANAALTDGETLLDVGCGDGLIAFGALPRVGESGRVIFSDISQDILDHAQSLAERLDVAERCQFVRASAEDLGAIASASIDVVTTRSVLAYVGSKQQAFAEFARVLKPGGRISLYEPINSLFYPEPSNDFFGYDTGPVQDLVERINTVYESRQPPQSDPMLDYDERDLLRFAADAGFGERHLELRIDVAPQSPQSWETLVRTAPNPLAPTLDEAMTEALSVDEAARFTAHLQPLVEQGRGTFSVAVAYLWAVRA